MARSMGGGGRRAAGAAAGWPWPPGAVVAATNRGDTVGAGHDSGGGRGGGHPQKHPPRLPCHPLFRCCCQRRRHRRCRCHRSRRRRARGDPQAHQQTGTAAVAAGCHGAPASMGGKCRPPTSRRRPRRPESVARVSWGCAGDGGGAEGKGGDRASAQGKAGRCTAGAGDDGHVYCCRAPSASLDPRPPPAPAILAVPCV